MNSPEEHLVFEAAVMGLFEKQLGARLTPALRERLAALGIDLSRPLPAYPMRVVDDGMELMPDTVLSDLPRPEALRALGRMQVEGFTASPLGWATFQLLRLLSAARQLERLTRSWRNANNFVETTVTSRGAAQYEVSVNDVGRFPEVIAGILDTALTAVGHRVRVSVKSRDGVAAVFLIAFSDG